MVDEEGAADQPEEAPIPEPDLLEPDPKPVRKTTRVKPTTGKITAQVKRDVRDALIMMITLPAGILMFRDPVCASAVLDHADNIADKLVPIVCRNPALLNWFTEGAGYMDWFALATALAPVARTVWSHHVTKAIADGEAEDEQPDYSGYTAPVFSG